MQVCANESMLIHLDRNLKGASNWFVWYEDLIIAVMFGDI